MGLMKISVGKINKIAKTVSGQTTITFCGMVFLQLTNFLAIMLISQGMSPAEVGRYQLLLSIVVVLSIGAKLGLDEGLSYYLPRYLEPDQAQAVGLVTYCLVVTATSSAVLACGVWFSSSIVNSLFFKLDSFDKDLEYLIFLLPSLVFALIGLSALRGWGRSDIRAYIYYFLMSGCFLFGVVVLRHKGFCLEQLLMLRSATFLLGAVGSFVALIYLKDKGITIPEKSAVVTLHSFSLNIIFVSILQYLVEQPLIDLTIVGRFLHDYEVGYYSIAARIGAMVALGFNAMTIVMAPKVSSVVYAGNKDDYLKVYNNANRWLLLLTSFSAGVLYLGLDVILLWFGEGYLTGKPIAIVFIFGYFLMSATGLNLPFMLAFGKQKYELFLGGLALLTMVLGGVVGVQLVGGIGVAIATVGALVFLNILRFFVLKKRSLPFPLFSNDSITIVLICCGSVYLSILFIGNLSIESKLLLTFLEITIFLLLFVVGTLLLERRARR